mmetsp:Transcript_8459/g.21653  ORF Transcript_8459/g.21653 Transcript_8459/m.21653 type:complete len:95 (+) Transcript_8459:841-1125(+)
MRARACACVRAVLRAATGTPVAHDIERASDPQSDPEKRQNAWCHAPLQRWWSRHAAWPREKAECMVATHATCRCSGGGLNGRTMAAATAAQQIP